MDRLTRHWALHWPGADIKAMADDVRQRAASAVDAWGLQHLTELPGGNVALVLAAEDMVLKVHPRSHPDDEQLIAEGVALQAWSATGAAAQLYGSRDGGFTLLLERLTPGTTLDAADISWDERLEVLGTLVGRLHSAPQPTAGSPHIGGTYSRDWRRTLGNSTLLTPADDDVLLHGDLHGGNALRAGTRWRIIDPHAVCGDRHADVWALIDPLAPVPSDARTARAWIRRYAASANLDPDRAADWVRFRARAEALAGADGDHAWAERLRHMADLLEVVDRPG